MQARTNDLGHEARLELRLLGGLEAHTATGPVEFAAKKAAALLAYLALAPDRAHARDSLVALLWEDSATSQGRTSLRQALSQLRKVLPGAGERALHTSMDSVTLAGDGVQVDVRVFLQRIDQGTPQALVEAMALYRGDFLSGFHARAPAFDDWLLAERHRLREAALQALDARLAQCLTLDDPALGLTLVRRQLALDPLRESAQRAAMTLYARQGQWAAALRQYQQFRSALKRELGVSPDAETERLHDELLQERGRGERTQSASSNSEHAAAQPSRSPSRAPASELREAALLVAALSQVEPADPELFAERVEQYHASAARCVERFGGSVVSRLGDTLMAVFGLTRAFGNEPERAARAAAALRDAVEVSGGGRVRAGIACGRVLATGPADVSGPVMQLAAALEDRAAAGEILLCETTRERLAERAEVEACGGAVPAYRLRSMHKPSSAAKRHALVGRAVELAQLRQALRTCMEARLGQTVVLRGEAGIGKTHLLDEAIAEAQRVGMHAHKILVFDDSAESGWDAVRALVCALLGLDAEAAGDAQASAAAERAVTEGLLHPDQRLFLEDLLRTAQVTDSAAEQRALDAPARFAGVRRALHDLLTGFARRQPLLLAIEDVHWAEADTLRWLAPGGLAADAPVVLVLTVRATGDADLSGLRQVIGSSPLLTLDLGPLRERDVRALAASFGGADQALDVAPDIDRAVERAEGNPWFLEQLLRAPPGAEVPGSIQSVVLARTDRLHALDRQALQAASVLGQRLSLAALRSVLGEADYDPQALIEHALLRADDRLLAFTHALLRDGVYDSLPTSRRQVLHARAARHFGAQDPVPYAEHLERAAQPEAPAALLEAARSLARGFQLERALRLIERGLHLAAQPRLRHELLRTQADLLRDLGRVEPSIAALQDALTLAETALDQAQVWLGLAAGMRVLDRHAEALHALDRAQDAAGEAAPLELRARIEALRGNVHFPLGHIEQCLAAHARARALSLQAGLPEAEARALGGLGDAYYQQGRMLTAFRHFDDCVQLAEAHHALAVVASNLPMRGIALLFHNRPAEGWQDCMRAADMAVRIGDSRSEVVARNAATLLLEQGELTRAEQEFQRALELSRGLGAQRFQAVCAAHVGSIAVQIGRREQGLGQLRAALAHSRTIGDSFATPWICGLLARASAGEERAQALSLGERVLQGGCVSHNHLFFYRYAIDAALAAADAASAQRYADALAAYTAAEPLPWADFYVRRGRLLARALAGAGVATADVERERAALVAEAREHRLLAALPALEAAFAAHASP